MFCTQCGAPNAETDHFCARCGKPLSRPQTANLSGAPAELASTETTIVAGPAVLYAGFWRRAGAYLIDYVIWTVLGFVFVVLAVMVGASDNSIGALYLAFAFFGYWLYKAVLESGPHQATWGKRAVGIQVTDLQGRRISFGRATGRYFATILSGLTLGVGYVMVAFTARKQALHDMVAGTLVVHRGTQNAAAGAMPTVKPMPGWAIGLIVLAGMIPITGILAAIAIPAYQDYTIRSQVVEGINLAGEYKAAVAEAWADGWDWNDIDSKFLDLKAETASQYVRSIEVYAGAIEIVYGKAANSHIDDRTLVMVPALNEDRELVWLCGYQPAPEGVKPMFESHWDFTDVEPKYLPVTCRPGS